MTAPRGRPREFDAGQALVAALGVFWRKGYDGASLSDLTRAMGISRPSLYAAFGNKRALFKLALDRYENEKLAYVGWAVTAPTARWVAGRLLAGAIDSINGQSRGCLGVITAMGASSEDCEIRREVCRLAQATRRTLTDRMLRARQEGDFDRPVEVEAITRYLLVLTQGFSVQVGLRAGRAELEQVAEVALATWPGR